MVSGRAARGSRRYQQEAVCPKSNNRMKNVRLIAGIVLLSIGGCAVAMAAGGANDVNVTFGQALTMVGGAAAAIVGSAWVQGLTVRQFIGRILSEEHEPSKYETIKHRMGSRNYGQAAVFIGTACLYMGTPQQCDELCDDLWHHGQQAHVQVLDGNETFDIL